MKTLLALVGLVIGCILSGCAHDTNTKAGSKPAAVAVADPSAFLVVTNTGTATLAYQWYKNTTNISGVAVTNQ
jgi:hypothetical protein